MHKSLLCICLFLVLRIHAETINGNCEIQQQPFGEVLFTLTPGTQVNCSPVKNGWCMIYTQVWIEKKMVYDGQQLLANAKLRNEKGKLIGRSKITFTPYKTIAENDTAFMMELSGYIESNCIEDTSIVEHELEFFFTGKDSLANVSGLTKHLKQFGYQPWINANGFQSYLLADIPYDNQSPGIRSVVVTEHEKIVAIIHGRHLKLKKYEAHVQLERYGIYFLKGGKEEDKKRFQQVFQQPIEELLKR